MNNLKGFLYGIATSVTFGLIPLFTLPLMAKGLRSGIDFIGFALYGFGHVSFLGI